jgi:hypothetical protein
MGCWVAAMAMLTGKTYAEVKAETGSAWKDGGHDWKTDQYLGQNGYAVARYYHHDQFKQTEPNEDGARFNIKREEWPMKSFAPVHMCVVRTSISHCVVMLPDGTVLDPATPELRTLTDYAEVIAMVGVWRVAAECTEAVNA